MGEDPPGGCGALGPHDRRGLYAASGFAFAAVDGTSRGLGMCGRLASQRSVLTGHLGVPVHTCNTPGLPSCGASMTASGFASGGSVRLSSRVRRGAELSASEASPSREEMGSAATAGAARPTPTDRLAAGLGWLRGLDHPLAEQGGLCDGKTTCWRSRNARPRDQGGAGCTSRNPPTPAPPSAGLPTCGPGPCLRAGPLP